LRSEQQTVTANSRKRLRFISCCLLFAGLPVCFTQEIHHADRAAGRRGYNLSPAFEVNPADVEAAPAHLKDDRVVAEGCLVSTGFCMKVSCGAGR